VSNLESVAPLAGLALAWGLGKGLVFGRHLTHAADCPMCAESLAKKIAQPKRFVTHNLVGPVVEEYAIRNNLQPKMGLYPTSALFGALHFSPRRGALANAWRVADATLGGILYGVAFQRHGLAASSLCHALHNLGADLGLLVTAEQGFTT
jgi:membrane protease YdiL (CAAX protease family)